MMTTFLTFTFKAIPLLLSIAWVVGAFLFYFRFERGKKTPNTPPKLPYSPKVTILVPCHNEERTIATTIRSLDKIQYPDFEVIAVNDGSRDGTSDVLVELASSRPWMRTIDLGKNRGKATALNVALLASRGEVILSIDADSELHPHAVTWLVHHLIENPKAGAVTGNPRVKNRDSLIGRLQVGEFSATIGMIKRYQQIIGKLFTVSGVIVAYRKQAILESGLWDAQCITEDIAVSWKLQTNGWDLVYEPRAICDVLMPGTLKGLWRQRLRWAKGGLEVMSKHLSVLKTPGNWPLKAIFLEYFFSLFWSFGFVLNIALIVYGKATNNPELTEVWFDPFHWGLFLIGVIGVAQILPGVAIHGRYEKSISIAYWAIWYPFVYWMLNTAVLIVAVGQNIFVKQQRFGTWVSPDRGGIT